MGGMTWNYRVVETVDDCGVAYSLHEVYYRKGAVTGITKYPCGFVGDSVWDLRRALWTALLDTFRRPVLEDEPCRYTLTEAGRKAVEGGNGL